MEFLIKAIKKANQAIINNSLLLKEIERAENERTIEWMCNECSGIEGSNINNGILTFKI